MNEYLQKLIEIAQKKGGKYVSGEYVTNTSRLTFQCAKGHVWEAAANKIQQGRWCPRCVGRYRTFDFLLEVASERDGQILDTEFHGNDYYYRWKCNKDGYVWEARLNNILHSHQWCPQCGKNPRGTIEEMREIAEGKGWKCLSDSYHGTHVKLAWQCEFGHVWEAMPANIKKGRRCPTCTHHKPIQIEEAHQIAKERGGECLSAVLDNGSQSMLTWKCALGHTWEANFNNIKSKNSWCPNCAHSGNVSEEFGILKMKRANELAEQHGGKCLSKHYISSKTKLEWQCKRGHTWVALASNIECLGRWCPQCARETCRYQKTIDDMSKLAENRGGKCLSEAYLGDDGYLKWECVKGHVWETTAHCVANGTWCPYCAGQNKTIRDMKEIAKERRGKCLSEEYVDGKSKLEWQCKRGHKWFATPNNITHSNSPTWCPHSPCQYENVPKKFDLTDLQNKAISNSGKCLSVQYTFCRDHFEWECHKGHTWKATWDNVQRGTWCPHCTEWKTEEKCREIFESIFQKPFKKTRSMLEGRLELDGYNDELKLAFEYQGEQHYKPVFHYQTWDSVMKTQERDRRKKKLCKQRGIRLIVIPYTKARKLEEFIKEQLSE